MSFGDDSTGAGSAQLPSLHPPRAKEAAPLAPPCPPPTATRSFTFYLHCREDRFISEGGRREIRRNPDFCFFRGPKSGGWGGGHTEKEVEPRVPDQRGTATLPSASAPGLEQKCPGSPRKPGQLSPLPWPGLARCKRRQPSVLHRKPLPPSGRVSAAVAGAEGLPQSGKTRKPDLTRPATAPLSPLGAP